MLGGLLIITGSLGPWMTPWMTDGSRMPEAALVQVGLASILVFVVVALGAPVSSGDAGDREERG
jgi:hypothetical protein